MLEFGNRFKLSQLRRQFAELLLGAKRASKFFEDAGRPGFGADSGINFADKVAFVHLVHAVDQLADSQALLTVETQVIAKNGVHEFAAVEPDLVHIGLSAESLENGINHGYHLVLGLDAFDAENIDVELPVLAQAAALRAFVAPQVRDAVPAQRIGQLLALGGHHPADRRRHFRPDDHFAAAAVFKNVGLLVDDLLAGLGQVNLQRLQNRRVILLVAKTLGHLAPLAEHVLLQALIRRVKIPRAFIWLGR